MPGLALLTPPVSPGPELVPCPVQPPHPPHLGPCSSPLLTSPATRVLILWSSFSPTPHIQGLNNAVALDFDYREQMIYWTDVTTQGSMIRRMHLNGSNVQVMPGSLHSSACPGFSLPSKLRE